MEADFSAETQLLSDVAAVRRTRLTTLGRLVTDPDVRRDFGFQFGEDEVLFDYETEDLRAGVSRIFSDLAARTGGVSVTDIKSKDQRLKYVADHSEVLPDRANRLSVPRRPGEHPKLGKSGENGDDGVGTAGGTGDTSGAETAMGNGLGRGGNESETSGAGRPNKGGGTSGDGRGGKNPPPENVISKSPKMPHLSSRIRELLSMAQKINIVDAAPICGILVRVLLELTVTEAMSRGVVTGVTEGDSLKKKVRHALLALDPACDNASRRDKSLEMAWTRTQDNDGLAVQSLNAFVHNIHGNVAPIEVRVLSLTFRPVLEGLNRLIGSSTK